MRVETPQILWNSEGNKGINAALYSISSLESGLSGDDNFSKYGHVMVTAGNTTMVNLWRLAFQKRASAAEKTVFLKSSNSTKIEYICSLTRHEQAVNTAAFSPNGLHLATAGDAGCIIVWSVPPSKRGNGNGRHYWSTITREQDLQVRIISRSGEGICDISWTADSKRFIVGTIDHSVLICEDQSYDANQTQIDQADSDWKIVYRNGIDHTHYVQGVATDPLGAYFASMGSDRSVRVYSRKTPRKCKKQVLRPSNAQGAVPPASHQARVTQLLSDSKLELAKSKLIKFRRTINDETSTQVKRHLYADESTLESFFRRLCWTTDGAYLVTPAALWHSDCAQDDNTAPSFATYLFARHKFDEPSRVLHGQEKPSVAVRPNPVLFTLPDTALNTEDGKENLSSSAKSPNELPYRSIVAVLTHDSVLIHDTHHTRPIAIVRGLHYANLVDCSWSADGLTLMVCSTDGYVSILSFDDGELGEKYIAPQAAPKEELPLVSRRIAPSPSSVPIPPCEPGQTATLEAPPAKRMKKSKVATEEKSGSIGTLCEKSSKSNENNCTQAPSHKRSLCGDADTVFVGEIVTKLSLNGDEKKVKKKKRIQPVLVSAND